MDMRGLLVGVDEVGRGPIAGPVCVGVFIATEKNILKIIKNAPHELKDSKKLTKIQRENWSNYLAQCKKDALCDFSINMQSNLVIDQRGIQHAIRKCVSNNFSKLKIDAKSRVLCDAGLRPPDVYQNYISIVKGDEREAVIAMASIVAKVHRDQFMTKLGLKYPDYGFEKHMGYGTAGHYKALENKGILPVHRQSYLKKMLD